MASKLFLVTLGAGLLVAIRPVLGGSPWLSGLALRQQFQARIDQVQWQGTPLRQAVEDLTRGRRVAVLLDRRIDPGRPLELKLDDVTLGDALWRIAQSQQVAVVPIGPVVYFGPADEVPKLETALELCRRESHRLPGDLRRPWMEIRPLAWGNLAVPRELLAKLADESGVQVAGLEQVPHDLWASADLPAMALVERIGLIAGQFGLMLRWDGVKGTARLVAIPPDVAVVESYSGGTQPQEVLRRWSAAVPGARLEVAEGKILVRGLLRDHRKIAALEKPARERKTSETRATEGSKRYTVPEARGPLGHLLEEFSRRLGLELKIDRVAMARSGISLDQPVTLSVHEASREELFRALLEPVGCAFHLEGQTLEVWPSK